MTSEEEEFEFRRRLESEQKAQAAPAAAELNALQKRMGLGKRGDTMEKIRETVDHAGYNVGGAATDLAAKVLPPEGAAAVGVGANIATEAIPAILGGEAFKVAAPLMRTQGLSLMQKALKPTINDLRLGKADRAAQTMLDEGLNVTRGGVEELRARATSLNAAVDDIVQRSGGTVDKNAVASRLQDLINSIERKDWTPQEGRAAVEKVYNEFLSNPLIPQNIPIAKAQELKQGIYQKLKDKYGTLGSETVEANKAGARGFKEEIERVAPDVAPLNAKASEMWNALNVAERRALMAGNNQVGGISWLSHNPWTFAASMADRSSLGQSLLARASYSGARNIPSAVGGAAGGILGASTGDEAGEGILSRRTSWFGAGDNK